MRGYDALVTVDEAIEIVDHDLKWPAQFGGERDRVRIGLGLHHMRYEHIGSTAVPGLAGKGVVDLMVLYPPGMLERARAALDALGFQRQSTRDPFPESRPMRIGAMRFDGKTFRLHAHVIASDDEEAATLRGFRDRLRADPKLRDAYVERKRAILASGITDTIDYAYAKSEFIQSTLDSISESLSGRPPG